MPSPASPQPDDLGPAAGHNVELKLRLGHRPDCHLAAVRSRAQSLATDVLGQQLQTDTYFHAPLGRLKLREIDGRAAELIAYRRADHHDSRSSSYLRVPVADPALLKSALSAALGLRVVVVKRRHILLYHNVRLHFYQVEHLGEFLEFEAVLPPAPPADRTPSPPTDDTQSGHRQIAWLVEQLHLADCPRIPTSYSDLLAQRLAPGPDTEP